MNFYDVLGVDDDADQSAIQSAYRELAGRYHPDVNQHPDASDQFKVVTEAREVLTDPEERNAYDRLGHTEYVQSRLDGELPTPDMSPRPGDDDSTVPADAAATDRVGATRDSGSAGSVGATPSETGAPESDGASATSEGGSAVGAADGEAPAGTATSGSGDESATNGSTADGRQATTSQESTSSRTPSGGNDSAHSTPPTPGTAGSSARGPDRISKDPTRRAARRMDGLRATVEAHFGASYRWLGVTAAAAAYAAGIASYIDAGGSPLDELVADLTSGDPQAVARAIGGGTYDAPSLLGFALGAGGGPTSIGGLLALVGAVALPIAVGAGVWGLRRHTTWRPSWLHLVGALGPAASIVLAFVDSTGAEAGGAGPVPLLVDLLLLVGVPAVVVASFLVNRLVVVAPLRRREDLGVP